MSRCSGSKPEHTLNGVDSEMGCGSVGGEPFLDSVSLGNGGRYSLAHRCFSLGPSGIEECQGKASSLDLIAPTLLDLTWVYGADSCSASL